jgi:hypothetical protein
MEPVSYVLYDLETGDLFGGYLQIPPEAHEHRIEVTDAERLSWWSYRANEARDGVELAPPAPPALPAPALIPQTVTMRQARLALLAAGKYAGVDAAIDSLATPQREAARIEWDYARDVERNSPIVSLMGVALELDDDALDALFVAAAAL